MVDDLVCRLCGTFNGIFIGLFEAKQREFLCKIEAVVPDVIILQHDSLSKVVCHRCVARVKEFYNFKQICIQTQNSLREKVPWMTHLDQNKDKIQQGQINRAPSPMVTYMTNSLAFPYGDPEKEAVEVLVLSDDEDVDCSTSQQTPPASAKIHHQQQKRPSINKSSEQPKRVYVGLKAQSSFSDQSQHISVLQPVVRPGPENTSVACPASKKQCLQPSSDYSLVNGVMKVKDSTRNTKLPEVQKGASSSISASSLPCSSASSSPSKIFYNNDVSVKKVLPKMPPAIPIQNVKPLPKTNNYTENAESFGNGSNHFSDGLVDGLSLTHPQIGQKSDERPKPKSKKKKKHTELSKEERERICSSYPFIKPLNIVHNSITIFTCSQCNKILVSENAIAKHECVVPLYEETSVSNDGSMNKVLTNESTVSEEETARACSSIQCSQSVVPQLTNVNQPLELIVSDDENSESSFTPKHTCAVCSKQFHNLARLEKHQAAH